MLDVFTPLSKLHRPARRVNDVSTFTANPGVWAYLASDKLYNITSTSTNQAQPQVLKPILGYASTSQYESNDIQVGRIATLEGVFRAQVDSNGYQVLVGGTGTEATTSLDYTVGGNLTVAYKVTSATAVTSQNFAFAQAADIGKLRPAVTGDVVVARLEAIDTTNSLLTFETVTPHIQA